ncbi:TVP38/TMEM64 family protein [Candidatus Woesearchaeota archaeon]|nr:TVP38/TMEM64 family protein [Candidatus Woesearchaeota archaeon]
MRRHYLQEKITNKSREISQKIRENRAKIMRNALILIIVLFFVGILLFYVEQTFESPRDAADKIKGLGLLGPVVTIAIIALEVVVAPIPGALIAVAAGYAFGVWWGTLISYIGNIIGTAIAFFISRSFGRPLVERLVSRKKLNTYDNFFHNRGTVVLWLGFIFPVFPSDIISFVVGLSRIRFRDFIMIISLAYIPNMLLLNYFGATLYESGLGKDTIYIAAFFVFMLILGFMAYLFLKKDTDSKG